MAHLASFLQRKLTVEQISNYHKTKNTAEGYPMSIFLTCPQKSTTYLYKPAAFKHV